MFLCSDCNVWINCSMAGRYYDIYRGRVDNWTDCTQRCDRVCRGSQSPHPTFWGGWSQYRADSPHLDSFYQQQMFVEQQNQNAHVGTVADNFYR